MADYYNEEELIENESENENEEDELTKYTRIEYNMLIISKGIDYVFDLHLYFMKEGPDCKNAENIRNYYVKYNRNN